VPHVHDRSVPACGASLPPPASRRGNPRVTVERTMGALFDFFADNPNVPKLLMRRIVDNEEIDVGIERDILVPAWTVFSQWLRGLRRRAFSEQQSRLFTLSTHSHQLD